MKKKRFWAYILGIIVLATFINYSMRGITIKQQYGQKRNESQLPFSEYGNKLEDAIIRVVIKTNGFKHIAHASMKVSCSKGLVLKHGERQEEYQASEIIEIFPDDTRFQDGSICIKGNDNAKLTIHSLNRGYGTPEYGGMMELYTTAEGVVVVNELPLESYLYAVVPSEMPSSYEIEALKCQAVCARNYAYCQMQNMAYPEYRAHVDDSTSFQVYGNSKTHQSTTRAVDETRGRLLTYQGNIIKTYYFSTSCGQTTNMEAWGSEINDNNRYLCGVSVADKEGNAYERNLPWYKWKAQIPKQIMKENIELNLMKKIGELINVEVTKTGKGGVVLQICVTGTNGKYVVDTENKIRRLFGGTQYKILKNDGTESVGKELLPSAFFTIKQEKGQYLIEGGGYGHGIGMSQNGANEMAKSGKCYEEILNTFYPGTEVK